MISLFDRSFPRVSLRRSLNLGSEGLLMGFVYEGDRMKGFHLSALVVTQNGDVNVVDASMMTMSYRYDVETDRWMDISIPSEPDQE